MPDKLDARWMRRWGIIDSDEHKQLLKYEGLHPDWLDRVALAEKMNMLSDEQISIPLTVLNRYHNLPRASAEAQRNLLHS